MIGQREESVKMEKFEEDSEDSLFEKLPNLESKSKPNSKVKKSLPPTKNNSSSEILDYENYWSERIYGSKDNDLRTSTKYELPNSNNEGPHLSEKNVTFSELSRKDNVSTNTLEFNPSETVDQKNSSQEDEPEENRHRIESMRQEIKQYQNIINLLRLELKPYRNGKSQDIETEIAKSQQLIQSLKDEIGEYKCKVESMQPEIMRYNRIIDSLKSEISGYKSEKRRVWDEMTQNQQLINSLRMELAEYKNKASITNSASSQYGNIVRSLSSEISRLKHNLDSILQME